MTKPIISTTIAHPTDDKQAGKKPEQQPSTQKPQNTEQGQVQKNIERK